MADLVVSAKKFKHSPVRLQPKGDTKVETNTDLPDIVRVELAQTQAGMVVWRLKGPRQSNHRLKHSGTFF